jgi:HEAT repeat protein
MDLLVRWALNLAPYLLLYIYFALSLQAASLKLGCRDSWKAWVPVYNFFYLIGLATESQRRTVGASFYRGKMAALLLLVLASFPAQFLLADRINLHFEIRTLKKGNPAERSRAIRALGATASRYPAAVSAIGEALQDEDYLVRMLAAYTLGDLKGGAVEAAPALCRALRDKENMVASQAAEALEQIARDSESARVVEVMIPPLVNAVKEGGRASAGFLARRVLRAIGDPAVPALVGLLSDRDRSSRVRALDVLRDMGQSKAAIPDMAAWLRGDDRDLRWRAAMVLAEIGPDAKPAVPALVESLRDPLPNSYGDAAAAALIRIALPAAESESVLVPLLKDKDGVVRQRAQRVLSTVGSHP